VLLSEASSVHIEDWCTTHGYIASLLTYKTGYHTNLGDNKRALWAFEMTLTGIVKFNYFIQSFVLRPLYF